MTQALSRPRAALSGFAAPSATDGVSSPGRIAGLDGLRAVAVIGVILFHAGVGWIPGGLLGVDVFFVISGFLITALLLAEHGRAGRISLAAFWMRRVRRLLPALVLMLLFVVIAWGVMSTGDVLSLRRDVFFAVGYGANWWFALSGQGYFQSLVPPSPVLHTWSLSVEEQFYLVWPLVVVVLLARGRRVGRWAAGGALLAAAATLAQSLAGVSTDRLYYGTDTRVVPLLVGAALGAWYVGRPPGAALPTTRRWVLQLAGLLAAAGLGWAFANVNGQSSVLYRGGFLVLALLVALLIACLALTPTGPLARLLGLAPLRWLGALSYGLYLWHWPLFLLVDHAHTGLSGASLMALRLLLTLIVAALSYRFIERPVRQRKLQIPVPGLATSIAFVALVGVLVVATQPSAATAPKVAPTSQSTVATRPQSEVGTVASRRAGIGTTRVLMVGDSLAYSLGNALALTDRRYRVHLDNVGLWGCGIARGGDRQVLGKTTVPPSFCATWPQRRSFEVAVDHPDVVALLVGLWEIVDQQHDGRWVHIGQPDFDHYLAGELDRAINVLSSTGARVALLTAPCLALPESPDGSSYPEADPARITRFNQLLRQAQRRHPATSTLVNFNGIACPGGKFTGQLAGVTIRTADGIHFPITPLPPIAAALLPQLRRIGADSRSHPPPAPPRRTR